VKIDETLRTMAATLDGLNVAMCAFDAEDRTIVWNRAFLRFFPEHAGHVHQGEPYRNNLRRFYLGRLSGEELARIERYIDEGIARHHAQQRPYTFSHRGSWLRVSSLPLPAGGRVRVWRQESTLRLIDTEEPAPLIGGASSGSATELFEHVGDGVLLTDAQNRITWVNEHGVSLLGLPDKAAAAGKDVESVYRWAWSRQPDLRPELLEAGLATLRENLEFAGAPFELALPGDRWIRVIEQRRRDGVGFFALVDISLLKRQQAELIAAERHARESERRLADQSTVLQATLERMEQGLMMINAAGVVEVCNRKAIELLGLPRALIDAKPTLAQVLEYQWSSGEFADTPEDLKQFIRAGGLVDQPQDYERRRPNGTVLEVRNIPIEGGGVLRSFTDITERRLAETRQRVLESQLREAQKLQAIGTLAGGIAHDFNNIMAAILGNVAFSMEAVAPDHAAQLYLGQIHKAGLRARTLVQQILAFSRHQSREFAVVAIQPLVEESIEMLRSMAGHPVRLTSVYPARPLAVMGNATQIEQVLLNLGANALQAVRESAGAVEIGFEIAQAAGNPWGPRSAGLHNVDCVRLWVRDDGCGMDGATRERIFEPFFSTKPVGMGTGLGLAVAHGIIDAHGGEIAVVSEPGRGSTFSVYLPMVAQEADALPPAPAEAGVRSGKGQHVLYVDDDEVMTVMVAGLLERLGYRASVASSARSAIDLLTPGDSDVDLVVTDFSMPQMSGIELARALVGLRPGLPVAITSGYISDELRAHAAELGVVGVMRKERTLEDLAALVHDALSGAQSRT
jgi:signal transduction histidine kinase/ActR/RegA family two-component response regulator